MSDVGAMIENSREVAKTMEMRKIDLACLLETKWKVAGLELV